MKKLTMAMMAAAIMSPLTYAANTVITIGASEEIIDVNPYVGEITIDMTGIRVQHEFDNDINLTVFYKEGMPDRVLQDRQTRTELMVGSNIRIKSVDLYGDIGYGQNQDSVSYKIINGGAFIPLTSDIFAHVNYLYRDEPSNATVRASYYIGYKVCDELVVQVGTGNTSGADYDMKHAALTLSYIF